MRFNTEEAPLTIMPTDDNDREPFQGVFPTLPIVTPDPVRLKDSEKYGGLFYLGVGGLVVILAIVGWFAWRAWSLREVWSNVYTLNDPTRSEADRVQAAYTLARHPGVNQRQLWDNALSKPLPPLARYILAESLTAEAASADPRAYGAAVAQSEGWPVWLRLLLTRPTAYAAALDLPVPRDSLLTLTRNPDRATALWATYALAEGSEGDPEAVSALRHEAETDGPYHDLAVELASGLDSTRFQDRFRALDAATLWLRTHHPDARRLWQGWRIEGGRIVRKE